MKSQASVYFYCLATLLIGLSVSSCTHNQSASDIISEGFKLANEGKYAEAQLKGLQAEQLLKSDSPLNYLEVLTVQQSLFSAQQSEVQCRYDEIAGIISLYHALGGGR